MNSLFYVAFCFLLTSFNLFAAEKQSQNEKLAEEARKHTFKLDYTDGRFSGTAWNLLIKEGKSSQFFLLGEEHGIAENPKLAAALFKALAPSGYSKFAIETSPQMAFALEQAARDGLDGLLKLFKTPASNVVFFGMLEEAQMLVELVKNLPNHSQSLWGLDYEVLADRYLISKLESKKKNKYAENQLSKLKQASIESWKTHKLTGGPQHIFSFAAKPSLISNLRLAWPEADTQAMAIMDTLEQTFIINQLWVSGKGWESNLQRATLLRNNFINYWQKLPKNTSKPKVFFKFGSSHLIRGRSMSEVYDLGNLLPELAALEGSKSFNLMVLQGNVSNTAVFDPTQLRYIESSPKDGYSKGLEVLTNLADKDTFTLIDLRPLRAILSRQKDEVNTELMRVVHGYDALLVLSASTASHNLLPALTSVKPNND